MYCIKNLFQFNDCILNNVYDQLRRSSTFEPDVVLYAVCLSYHSNTEAVFFACLSLGWATTTGRLLVPKVETALRVFPKDTTTRYRIGNRTKFSQPFDY